MSSIMINCVYENRPKLQQSGGSDSFKQDF